MAVTPAGERECRCFRAVTVAADFAVLELSIEENVLNGKRAAEHGAGNSLFVGNSLKSHPRPSTPSFNRSVSG